MPQTLCPTARGQAAGAAGRRGSPDGLEETGAHPEHPELTGSRLRWQDLLLAALPLLLTVLLLWVSFSPTVRALSTPDPSWTGFPYEALVSRLYAYELGLLGAPIPAAARERQRQQALSSLNNPHEFVALSLVESLGSARLAHIRSLTLQNTLPSLQRAVQEAEALNGQAHERLNALHLMYAAELARLRALLIATAFLTGSLSMGLILRALLLARRERQQRVLLQQRHAQLLSLASHELRRPLQTLLTVSELLRGPQSAEQREQFLRLVEDSAAQLVARSDLRRLEALYGDLRFQPDLQLETCDLRRLLEALNTSLADPVQAARVQLQLPPGQLSWRADPARVRQIMENLLENALKYSAGEVTLGFGWVRARPSLWVQDQGEALPGGLNDGLFAASVRGHQGGEGLGLGLAIARQLARAHGGDVQLVRVDGGTRATLLLGIPGGAAGSELG